MNEMSLYLISAVAVGTPILLACIGEILTQKAGNMNLGVEGMMLIGAVIGFKVGYATHNPYLVILAACVAGALAATLYGFITITLRCNQTVTGLTLTIFGQGFANFIGSNYVGTRLSDEFTAHFKNISIPILSEIPVLGPTFFNQNILVYITYFILLVVAIYLYKTNGGINLRIVGENPAAADALGIWVNGYKYVHILISGVLSGLAGAYICCVTLPAWQNDIVAGKGWIAVALVIFAGWNPLKAFLGAILFGLLSILGIRLQKYNLPISQYLFDMLPYLMTIVVLLIGSLKKNGKTAQPAGLGEAYFRESR